ncbi:DNA-binding protein Alba [Nanoarchaeota archaeon]|nr:MAG: DNA-binding protein Alba [Nanoarchaeota archaeon]
MAEILIGKKPTMTYVVAVLSRLRGKEDIVIKARGRLISKAIDVAEIVRHRFATDIQLKEIKIGTETIDTQQGQKNVSFIELTLGK